MFPVLSIVLLNVLLLFQQTLQNPTTPIQDEEAQASVYVKNLNNILENVNYDQVVATWNYNTDINDKNKNILVSFHLLRLF